jgi:hypothetical protein
MATLGWIRDSIGGAANSIYEAGFNGIADGRGIPLFLLVIFGIALAGWTRSKPTT